LSPFGENHIAELSEKISSAKNRKYKKVGKLNSPKLLAKLPAK